MGGQRILGNRICTGVPKPFDSPHTSIIPKAGWGMWADSTSPLPGPHTFTPHIRPPMSLTPRTPHTDNCCAPAHPSYPPPSSQRRAGSRRSTFPAASAPQCPPARSTPLSPKSPPLNIYTHTKIASPKVPYAYTYLHHPKGGLRHIRALPQRPEAHNVLQPGALTVHCFGASR